MINFKTPNVEMESIDPSKRLIIGIFRQAVYDYRNPEQNPLHALSAGVFLIMGQELAFLLGWFADERQWERIIANL